MRYITNLFLLSLGVLYSKFIEQVGQLSSDASMFSPVHCVKRGRLRKTPLFWYSHLRRDDDRYRSPIAHVTNRPPTQTYGLAQHICTPYCEPLEPILPKIYITKHCCSSPTCSPNTQQSSRAIRAGTRTLRIRWTTRTRNWTVDNRGPSRGGGGLVLCAMCKIYLLAMCYVSFCSHWYVKLK